MSTDSNRMTDGVDAELNPPDADGPAGDAAPALQRPADGAAKAAWVDYLVDLGADRAFLEGGSEHWSDAEQTYVPADGMTRDELRALADRLEGRPE